MRVRCSATGVATWRVLIRWRYRRLTIGPHSPPSKGAASLLGRGHCLGGGRVSIVGGLTYNFINPYTQYQNGIDSHIDWAASHFLNKNVLVGIAGYYFQQLTGDRGAGATLGNFQGRVVGVGHVGPQIGFFFPVSEAYQGYLNVKAYKDFAAENRPEGYTARVTLAISPAAPSETPTEARSIRNSR